MNWLVYALLGVVLMGASPVLAKSGMHKSNSHLAAALRGTCLFLSAWIMVGATGTDMNLTNLGQRTWLYLLFVGIATGVVWICFVRALQLGEVIKVVPIVEGSIVLNTLVGIFFFKDEVTWNIIIILLILIAGVVMISYRKSGRGARSNAWIGYALGATVLTTVILTLERIGISGINDNYERLIRYGIAFMVVWLTTFATGGYKGLRAMSFLDGVYLCLSGIAMGGAWYCFHNAYALGTNANVAIVERFDLVTAVVLGCVFLRERLSVRAIFGLIFMMIGFLLFIVDLPVIPI